jgi:hypothetical protein
MDDKPGIIQRAFELAKNGECLSVEDIRSQLVREQYDQIAGHLGGSTITRQLRQLLAEKRRDHAGLRGG